MIQEYFFAFGINKHLILDAHQPLKYMSSILIVISIFIHYNIANYIFQPPREQEKYDVHLVNLKTSDPNRPCYTSEHVRMGKL